jgi:hypothetical protein
MKAFMARIGPRATIFGADTDHNNYDDGSNKESCPF